MSTPSDRRYTDSHEWHRVDGDLVTIGITKFAVDELTDVTFVDLRPAGTTIEAGGIIGEVESVKATSDIYSAIPGEITEINETLSGDPSTLNSDPYDAGWLVKIKPADTTPLDALMDQPTYDGKYTT